jgi:alpha-D-ribose 1-methylphosphonate 5-triphosphate synthase subunit PhnI
MGYVAVKGGTQAVLNAEELVEYFRLKGGSEPISVRQIQDQMRLAVDRAMSEGSLYAPELAALALKQSEGDSLEASFLLRAYRSTVPRIDFSLPAEGVRMRLLRHISATFKDIPGGQLLGPSRDYHLRLLNTLLKQESSESVQRYLSYVEGKTNTVGVELPSHDAPTQFPNANLLDASDIASLESSISEGLGHGVELSSFSRSVRGYCNKVIESMRAQGILAEPPSQEQAEADAEPYDITRQALTFPAPRSARLQVLTQADAGSVLAFAYSSVRGYGDVHPTLGELRIGYLPVEVAHPLTGEPVEIGEILATECEMVSRVQTDEQQGQEASLPRFGLGYGFCFGQSETKAMSMSMLDRVLSAAKESAVHGEDGPAANEEFVLSHVDGVEASGFTAHYKLPHYVSFQSDMSVLERTRKHRAKKFAEAIEKRRQATNIMESFTTLNEEDKQV